MDYSLNPTRVQVSPRPSWEHLVRATVNSHVSAYGCDGAQSLLREHAPHWPDEARKALVRIIREGGCE